MTSVTKTVAYSLTATSIDEMQMTKISIPIYKTALPRMGILPTLPLAFRYASSRYQGLDLMNFDTEQLIQKTEMFITHANQPTQVGTGILLTIEDIHLEVGVVDHLFDLPYQDFGYLPQCSWIRHLWKTCHKHRLSLRGEYVRSKLR